MTKAWKQLFSVNGEDSDTLEGWAYPGGVLVRSTQTYTDYGPPAVRVTESMVNVPGAKIVGNVVDGWELVGK